MEDVYSRLLPPIQIAPRQNSCKLQNGKRNSPPPASHWMQGHSHEPGGVMG